VNVIIDHGRYRSVLGHLPTGVVVVAAVDAGEPVGMAVGSFTSVSLDPPLVGFFADRGSSTLPRLRAAGAFSVSVLSSDQEDICRRFAAKGANKFAGIRWQPGKSGSPILAGALAYVECRLDAVREVGDHLLVVGEVIELDVLSSAAPLVFHRGRYSRLGG
jgi:3-hydroxy-9,10-secoandrosta-1,3,5(10)-triene-9,17-dione monooxygenase reductase component